VTRGGGTVLSIPLLQLLDSLTTFTGPRAYQVPERLITVQSRTGDAAALVRLTNIAATNVRPRRITSVSGEVYLRLP
jgi:hypothetical protein